MSLLPGYEKMMEKPRQFRKQTDKSTASGCANMQLVDSRWRWENRRNSKTYKNYKTAYLQTYISDCTWGPTRCKVIAFKSE